MSKLTINGNPPAEIDAEDAKNTVHAKDSRSDRSVLKKIEVIKSDVHLTRCEIKSVGAENHSLRDELIKHTANNEKLKVDADSTSADLKELKVKMREEFKQLRADNREIGKELKAHVEGEKVRDVAAVLGAGVLMKGLLKKALPWRKS